MQLVHVLLFLLVASSAIASEPPAWVADSGAARWHTDGWTGKGVKVVVLDSGFRGHHECWGRSLPRNIVYRSFRADGDLEARNSPHGIRCAEVIHVMAPDAELLFANWEPDDPRTFLRAVRWAREQGAGVISCSVVVPGWGDGRGEGPINRELTSALGDGTSTTDPVMAAAAGNLAARHWAGPFAGNGPWHQWSGGKVDNPLRPWGTQTVAIDLAPSRGSTYRIRLMDDAGRPVDRVHEILTPSGGVSARFTPDLATTYRLRIEHVGGSTGPIRLTVLGADLEFSSRPNSIAFPAENRRVLAVGASDRDGRRCPFSGCGPAGNKPDLVGPAPVVAGGRVEPFGGTSAAAPQVAGLAALVRCRYPDWPAHRVAEFLQKSARDVGVPGPDAETGFGLLRLPPN